MRVAVFAALLSLCGALSHTRYGAFDSFQQDTARGSLQSGDPLTVDLGYGIYRGYVNETSGFQLWRGIRFAAPPTGALRWQPPQIPQKDRSTVINATHFAPQCPQSPAAPYMGDLCDIPANATSLPAACLNSTYFQKDIKGNEDCLFLNIYKPPNAKHLPVLVYIHGGGYGQGDSLQDMTAIIQANENGFIGITINYRLGAFGFLSSADIYKAGAANAGLLDQHFALQWVQSFIQDFGGDPTRVTISGESAGGGSVMLHDLAYGGRQGTRLFQNAIVASPYLPMQHHYNDAAPEHYYQSFISKAGCSDPGDETPLQCLLHQDTYILQQASAIVSASGLYGTWAFVPVTDGTFVEQLPSQQLLQGKVNADRFLSGNNANEGFGFTPQNISSESDFIAYVKARFPRFTAADIALLEFIYPDLSKHSTADAPLFATLGDRGPTALNQSSFGTGQQQRANNLYAESTFVCPSYWLAEAHAGHDYLGSFKYQFSVPPAFHSADFPGYFGSVISKTLSPEFQMTFMRIWGNFVTRNNPTVANITFASSAHAMDETGSTKKSRSWPAYSLNSSKVAHILSKTNARNPETFPRPFPAPFLNPPLQLNINVTGGQPTTMTFKPGHGSKKIIVPESIGPGLQTVLELVDAWNWEGGRGWRCEFWRFLGSRVPE